MVVVDKNILLAIIGVLVVIVLVILLLKFFMFTVTMTAVSCLVFLIFKLWSMSSSSYENEKEDIFPFRNFVDEKGNKVPIVTLTAFFREGSKELYKKYLSRGIKVIGFTSYKTFPKPISDKSGDHDSMDDTFRYTSEIKNWAVCFKNLEEYGFTSFNNTIELSESDFQDASTEPKQVAKKYDFIYSCLSDDDEGVCPAGGWNAINRNFDLAKRCFPIMINEFGLKLLVVGRKNCGLEDLYGDKIEVVEFLPYDQFQEKMAQSKYLFVPNIYDASPRVVTEALSKGLPVLMNRQIVCGSKYITNETGELFTDEHDIRYHLKKLLNRKMDTVAWWSKNYSRESAGKKFRDFLHSCYPDVPEVTRAREIYFG